MHNSHALYILLNRMAVKFQMLFIVLRVLGITLPKKGSGAEIDGYLLSSMKANPKNGGSSVVIGPGSNFFRKTCITRYHYIIFMKPQISKGMS